MTLSLFYCMLLLTLLCRIFGNVKNHALFGVKFVTLKFGWCKKMTCCKSAARWCGGHPGKGKRGQMFGAQNFCLGYRVSGGGRDATMTQISCAQGNK